MALIRAEHAIDFREKATTLDLSDIAAGAQKIRDEAAEEARRIVEQAREERERLISDANEVGHQEGFAKGHADGFEAGSLEGKEAAEEEWHGKIMALAAAWGDALTSLEQQRKAVLHSVETDALRLVADIASRVAKRAVALDHSETARQSLVEAISRIDHATRVTIEVHPSDLDATDRGLGAVAELLMGSPDLRLRSNEEIDPGSIIVESDAACIDASIQNSIRKLVDAILPEPVTLEQRLESTLQDDVADSTDLEESTDSKSTQEEVRDPGSVSNDSEDSHGHDQQADPDDVDEEVSGDLP